MTNTNMENNLSVRSSSDHQAQTRFRGVPESLLPKPTRGNRFEIVRHGLRNLEARPFDYRNPFPLTKLEPCPVDNGPASSPLSDWPLRDDRIDSFDYYCNDNVAVGLPDGPECALVDRWGNLSLIHI